MFRRVERKGTDWDLTEKTSRPSDNSSLRPLPAAPPPLRYYFTANINILKDLLLPPFPSILSVTMKTTTAARKNKRQRRRRRRQRLPVDIATTIPLSVLDSSSLPSRSSLPPIPWALKSLLDFLHHRYTLGRIVVSQLQTVIPLSTVITHLEIRLPLLLGLCPSLWQ